MGLPSRSIIRFSLGVWVVSAVTAAPAAEPTAEAVNARLGVPLFAAGQSLWAEDAEVVAERLGLRRGSETAQGRIWRSRAATVFALPAQEVRLLETAARRPSALEVNLINKGDYFTDAALRRRAERQSPDGGGGSPAGGIADPQVRQDLERLFPKDLAACEDAAEAALAALFGDGRGQSFRQAERQRLRRWDWQGTAFLLDARKGEFVMVRILPSEQADAGGRSERRTDRAVKQDLAANVARGRQGDVWIRNIPMVDQGEKGYCAVATAERLLRYYGIAVDSHDLADAAQTARGGGTTWDDMCSAMERLATRNQRRFRVLGGTVSARSVGRYVDKGMPVVWGLFVTPALEEAVRRRAAERDGMSAPDWRQRLKDERRATRRLRPDKAGGHLRLIVGYNEETQEIAYSDSWGDARIYWISEDEAQAVSFPGSCLAAVLP